MEKKETEFISYKKLAIFGTKKTGKSTIVSKMEGNSFSEEYTETDQRNIFTLIFIRSKIK